jgi:hydroxyacylglutathione hydrolase
LCGAGIGKDPYSTIGRERELNPMLRYRDADEFVRAVLADLPETPAYFARMKRVNREGAPLRGLAERSIAVPKLKAGAAAALAADGALIVDLRADDTFAGEHPAGALNFPFGPKIGYWAGWILGPDVPLVLFADDPAQANEAALQLARVGLDRVEGFVDGGIAAWRSACLPTATLDRIPAEEVRAALARHDPIHIVDVRTEKEWNAGHIDGASHIPLGELPARIGDIPLDVTVATICEGGYRSSIASSFLQREGVAHAANIVGGMSAYRNVEVT